MGEFAAWLTRRRKLKGLTHAQFAALIESNERTVRRWEAGDGLPTRNKLRAVARAFGEPEGGMIAAVYGHGPLPEAKTTDDDLRLSRFAMGKIREWAGDGRDAADWLGAFVEAAAEHPAIELFVRALASRTRETEAQAVAGGAKPIGAATPDVPGKSGASAVLAPPAGRSRLATR
jgi:transcriptional regulator with XRE-family HTH domain